MGGIGPMFGLTRLQSIRSGLLLAAGGEFAFVAFGAPHLLTCLIYLCQGLLLAAGCKIGFVAFGAPHLLNHLNEI